MLSEVERNIVTQRSSRINRDDPPSPLVDQFGVPNLSKVRGDNLRIATMDAVLQQPRHVVDVRDSKNVRILLRDFAHL